MYTPSITSCLNRFAQLQLAGRRAIQQTAHTTHLISPLRTDIAKQATELAKHLAEISQPPAYGSRVEALIFNKLRLSATPVHLFNPVRDSIQGWSSQVDPSSLFSAIDANIVDACQGIPFGKALGVEVGCFIRETGKGALEALSNRMNYMDEWVDWAIDRAKKDPRYKSVLTRVNLSALVAPSKSAPYHHFNRLNQVNLKLIKALGICISPNLFTSASRDYSKANQGVTPEECVALYLDGLNHLRTFDHLWTEKDLMSVLVYISGPFGVFKPEDNIETAIQIIQKLKRSNPDLIMRTAFGDTKGMMTPDNCIALHDALEEHKINKTRVDFHLHAPSYNPNDLQQVRQSRSQVLTNILVLRGLGHNNIHTTMGGCGYNPISRDSDSIVESGNIPTLLALCLTGFTTLFRRDDRINALTRAITTGHIEYEAQFGPQNNLYITPLIKGLTTEDLREAVELAVNHLDKNQRLISQYPSRGL